MITLRQDPALETTAKLFDTLCPMHVILNATGHVVHAGPTVMKILGNETVIGRRFHELFELKRPYIDPGMPDLLRASGKRLHFMLRNAARTEIKGVLFPLPETGALGPVGGAVINLSFGISVVGAVREYGLTGADFATTDLAVEMLYLVEAKSAAMDASRKLNLRLQGAKVAAEEWAFTDGLTGLRNRRALEPVVSRLIEMDEDFALMQMDLDHFKSVNDTLGHAAGDHVLREVATVLREETRTGDTIIRVGGDEFVLVFAPLTNPVDLEQIATRLIERLGSPIGYKDHICQISGSIGATLSRDYGAPELAQMMEDSDRALYAAKSAGRGCHVLFSTDLTVAPVETEVAGLDPQR